MTVLRGPADADHYRVKVGRYGDRWYVDPLPACPIATATDAQWPSVSSVKNANGSDWTFVGLERVAQALEARPNALAGLTYDDRYDTLKAINKSGLRHAQKRGTMVHAYLERGLRGEPLQQQFDDTQGVDYLPAVSNFLDTYQPELIAAELVCINRGMHGYGYGGTADAIIRIDGQTYLPDWKSRGEDSNHGAYADEARQLGAYALADYILADGPKRVPVPQIDAGLIVSIKPDGVRIYPVDLDKAKKAWTDLHLWWISKMTEKDAIGKPWAPRAHFDPLESLIAAADSSDALRDLWRRYAASWQPIHTEQAKARRADIEKGQAA